MIHKMSKKSVPLPSRPDPPTMEEIVEDVENAGRDDIVFTLVPKEIEDFDSPVTPESDAYSFEDSGAKSPAADAENSDSTPGGAASGSDVNLVYNKAVELLELTEKLKTAPDALKAQSDRLQELGQELRDSIDELKQQAQIALDKSMSSSS